MKRMSIEIYQSLRQDSEQLDAILAIKNKDYQTIDNFREWLVSVEDHLRRNNMEDFRRIAEIRGKLIASQVAFDRNVPKLKRQLRATSELLELSKNTMETIMEPIEVYYQKPRKIMKKMLMIADHEGLIQWNKELKFRDFVHALWRIFNRESLYKNYCIELLKKVTDEEAIMLLADEVKIYKK